MAESGFAAEVQAVGWHGLESAYGSGEVVRDIVLGLASQDEADVAEAWAQIGKTVLQHQGTVYPATAAAAPFCCRLVLDPATRWRAALAAELPRWSTGYDQPYSPAGTAQAVRDAVRPYIGELLKLWGTDDEGLDMALVAVSVAFPVEAKAIAAPLQDWFARSQAPLRTTLGLALGFHSSADEAARGIVEDEVRQSIRWISRSKRLIHINPSPSSPSNEPSIDSPVIEAIRLARRLQAGDQEKTADFHVILRFLLRLLEYSDNSLIKYPG